MKLKAENKFHRRKPTYIYYFRPVLRLSRCPEFRGGGARGSLRVAAEGGTARTCIIIGKRVPWKEGSARLKCPTKLECPPSCPAEQRSAEPRGEKP